MRVKYLAAIQEKLVDGKTELPRSLRHGSSSPTVLSGPSIMIGVVGSHHRFHTEANTLELCHLQSPCDERGCGTVAAYL